MRNLGKTPPFRGPHGEVASGSVAEVAYHRLGGVDQWVMIRGESLANPPLIMLHGGQTERRYLTKRLKQVSTGPAPAEAEGA